MARWWAVGFIQVSFQFFERRDVLFHGVSILEILQFVSVMRCCSS